MQNIKLKQAASYVIMPGILPRLKDLFTGGTGILAFLIASIFQTARLLPRNHPYLSPANMRKFGIRDVFAQAGSNLVFDRYHADQVVIFFTMMLGFVLLILQFVILGVGLVINHAHALPAGMFVTQNPTNDIAFQLLDRVFGVPDLFNSCVAQMAPCGSQPPIDVFPTPFNLALQNLFQYYSVGVLCIGVLIFLYYMVVVVAETAQTGTPFGRRFSHIWAPIRLVVAIGLLIPVSYGLNSAQFIVLYAAKEGSGFATNGWNLYNETLENGLGVDTQTLYARPNPPDAWPLVKFILMAATCRDAYGRMDVPDIQAYMIKGTDSVQVGDGSGYDAAIDFYNKGDVVIRFGQKNDKWSKYVGNVRPYCGEITIPTQAAIKTGTLAGPYRVQQVYWDTILYYWDSQAFKDFATVIMRQMDGVDVACAVNEPGLDCATGVGSVFVSNQRTDMQAAVEYGIDDGRAQMIAAGNMGVDPLLLEFGWGGAGIWYNKIAEVNGAYIGAVNSVPTPSLLPLPMEIVQKSRQGSDQNFDVDDWFTMGQSNENKMQINSSQDQDVAKVLERAYKSLGKDSVYQSSDAQNKNNIFKDAINLLFGTEGLFTMRNNTDIHPLAQLVGLGKGIMDATVRNLFTATVFSVGGGFMSAFGKTAGVGKFMTMAAGILVTISTISLTIGFVLYYVLPFLPFMYFFFSVGAWVKAIFEAMVGVPLWALGHLRIDGHGLPGESALDGYYMILEIFLRPILTVFGLIGGLITFTALAKVLNEVFKLVTDNLSGFNVNPSLNGAAAGPATAEMLAWKRDVIDEFFFTIIYTVIIYMMATGSFKMIDQIPARALRWMGAGVQAFTEHNAAEDGMNRYLVGGAANMASSLGQNLANTGAGLGNIAGRMAGGKNGLPKADVTGKPSQGLGADREATRAAEREKALTEMKNKFGPGSPQSPTKKN